jgi:uncharacterized caspase-like protein
MVQEYSRWDSIRRDVNSRIPMSKEEAAISDFIGDGFGDAPVTVTTPPNASISTTSPSSSPSPQTRHDMKVWAVVVGVADYKSIDKLNYTDDDAYRMYAFYKSPEGGSLPDNQIKVLIDEDATHSHVIQTMKDIYSRAGQNDAIVFYFSGHGSPQAFITQEYGSNLANNGGLLFHEEINAIFAKSSAKYKYIIADACHSGNWKTRGVKSAADVEQQYYQTFENSRGGFVLLLSSMGNEYSIESSGVRQGIFSHFLIRGLKGEADENRDNIVSVNELFRFVNSNVVTTTNHQQNPVISGDYKNDPPVAVVRIE